MEEAGRTQYNFSFEGTKFNTALHDTPDQHPAMQQKQEGILCGIGDSHTYPDDPMILITQNIEFYKKKCR
jgi:hypothetical protein